MDGKKVQYVRVSRFKTRVISVILLAVAVVVGWLFWQNCPRENQRDTQVELA
ncbi:hypothetical protein EVA_20502, partial [gut metagenome]